MYNGAEVGVCGLFRQFSALKVLQVEMLGSRMTGVDIWVGESMGLSIKCGQIGGIAGRATAHIKSLHSPCRHKMDVVARRNGSRRLYHKT